MKISSIHLSSLPSICKKTRRPFGSAYGPVTSFKRVIFSDGGKAGKRPFLRKSLNFKFTHKAFCLPYHHPKSSSFIELTGPSHTQKSGSVRCETPGIKKMRFVTANCKIYNFASGKTPIAPRTCHFSCQGAQMKGYRTRSGSVYT